MIYWDVSRFNERWLKFGSRKEAFDNEGHYKGVRRGVVTWKFRSMYDPVTMSLRRQNGKGSQLTETLPWLYLIVLSMWRTKYRKSLRKFTNDREDPDYGKVSLRTEVNHLLRSRLLNQKNLIYVRFLDRNFYIHTVSEKFYDYLTLCNPM